jgi:hypothetical protein
METKIAFVVLAIVTVLTLSSMPLDVSAVRSNTLNFTITEGDYVILPRVNLTVVDTLDNGSLVFRQEEQGPTHILRQWYENNQARVKELSRCLEEQDENPNFTIVGTKEELQQGLMEEERMLQVCRDNWQARGQTTVATNITIYTDAHAYNLDSTVPSDSTVVVWGAIDKKLVELGEPVFIRVLADGTLYTSEQIAVEEDSGVYSLLLPIAQGSAAGKWTVTAEYSGSGRQVDAETVFEVKSEQGEAPSRELAVQTDKESYSKDGTVVVTGNVTERGTWTMELRSYDISLQIFDSQGALYLADQVSVTNEGGMQYEWGFALGQEGPVIPGEYLVIAQSNEMVAETSFEVTEISSPSGNGAISVDIVGVNGSDSGQSIVVHIDNTGIGEDQGQHVQVVEIRGSDGVTEFLQLQPLSGDNTEISWTLKSTGNYQVRTFIIDDVTKPQMIMQVETHDFRI